MGHLLLENLNRSHQSNFETTRTSACLYHDPDCTGCRYEYIFLNGNAGYGKRGRLSVFRKVWGSLRPLSSWQYIITAALAGGTGSLIGIGIGCALALNLNSLIRGAESVVNFFRLPPFPALREEGEALPMWNCSTGPIIWMSSLWISKSLFLPLSSEEPFFSLYCRFSDSCAESFQD